MHVFHWSDGLLFTITTKRSSMQSEFNLLRLFIRRSVFYILVYFCVGANVPWSATLPNLECNEFIKCTIFKQYLILFNRSMQHSSRALATTTEAQRSSTFCEYLPSNLSAIIVPLVMCCAKTSWQYYACVMYAACHGIVWLCCDRSASH